MKGFDVTIKIPYIGHQRISFIKSGVRLTGYLSYFYSVGVAIPLLVLAELLGIYEEVGRE